MSLFTSSYVYNFDTYFTEYKKPLRVPSFDARIVLYPTIEDLKAYLSWRQVDCHINNLYNTTFWALVKKGNMTNAEAHKRLKGTFSKDKHELMHSEFGMNYANEKDVHKRGSIFIRMLSKKEKKQQQKDLRKIQKTDEKQQIDSTVVVPQEDKVIK